MGGPQRGRADRAGGAAVRAGHRGRALPGGVAAGGGAPPGRAHRGAGVVGHAVPGGARRPRHGGRARARHARRDREGHLHRPPRWPAAVAGGQGGGGAGVRPGTRGGSRPELRLLQRRRGRPVPADRRPPACAQPGFRPGGGGGGVRLADRPVPATRPGGGARGGPHGGRGRRHAHRLRRGPRAGRAQRVAARRHRPGHHARRGAGCRARRCPPRRPGCGEPGGPPGPRCSCSTTRASSTC